jgi:hypothetical protein
LLVFAMDGIVLGIGLVFFILPGRDHVLGWGMELGWRRPKSSMVRRW